MRQRTGLVALALSQTAHTHVIARVAIVCSICVYVYMCTYTRSAELEGGRQSFFLQRESELHATARVYISGVRWDVGVCMCARAATIFYPR